MTDVKSGFAPMCPNRIITELIADSRASTVIPDSLEIALNLEPDLPGIISDGNLLRRLILCFIENAIDAMPNGGLATITTKAWRDGNATSYIEIAFEDHGSKLPEEVMWNLYQPFSSPMVEEKFFIWTALVRQLVRGLCALINWRTGEQGTRYLLLLPVS